MERGQTRSARVPERLVELLKQTNNKHSSRSRAENLLPSAEPVNLRVADLWARCLPPGQAQVDAGDRARQLRDGSAASVIHCGVLSWEAVLRTRLCPS